MDLSLLPHSQTECELSPNIFHRYVLRKCGELEFGACLVFKSYQNALLKPPYLQNPNSIFEFNFRFGPYILPMKTHLRSAFVALDTLLYDLKVTILS